MEPWTVNFNQMIKYQLTHMQFDQIDDHKDEIYLYGKQSTCLLARAAIKNIEFMFTKTGRLLFFDIQFHKWLSDKVINKHFRRMKKYMPSN